MASSCCCLLLPCVYRHGASHLRTPGQLRQRAAELDDLLRRLLGKRFSALDQINTGNAHELVAKWVYQLGSTGKMETSPLEVDGVLYATGPDDRAFALDARTGRPIWMYQRQLPSDIRPCCGRVNRGLAILGGKVFLGTLDAHVVALDAKTGAVIWDVTAADYRIGNSFTVAPLAVKDQIIIGVSGGEYGIRGFIDAYDAATGQRKWRFYTVPGPGEPGHDSWEGESWKVGGAPAWNTGTFDPATNQIFWPTGNPSPSNRGMGRAGDNLYSNSLLALDADTGNLKWYFQFTKHDEHDWDATQIPVMIDDGDKHLIVQANRNGFFYVLDRASGKLLSATPTATDLEQLQRAEGRPVAKREASPTLGHTVCPGALGARTSGAHVRPADRLFYVTARDQCDIFSTAPQPSKQDTPFTAALISRPKRRSRSRIPSDRSNHRRNQRQISAPIPDVVRRALDRGRAGLHRRRGRELHRLRRLQLKPLWHFQMGAAVYASPIAFALDGKEYVTIAAGSALYAFGLP